MQRHPQYTRKRIAQFAQRLRARIYPETQPLDVLEVAGPVDRIGFEEAMKLEYGPAQPPMPLGPDFATFWFKAKATVPDSFEGYRVDLLWSTHSENTLWLDGRAVQGLNDGEGMVRPEAELVGKARRGQRLEFAIETACNRLFGVRIHKPYRSLSPFVLDRAEIGRFDPLAWQFYHDFAFLAELEADLSRDSGNVDRTFAGELLATLNEVCNLADEQVPTTWGRSMDMLRSLYERHTAAQVHELSAIGHAHIDTAWLWPLAETDRKCQRSFANALRLMEDYPEYRFACSQACQYIRIRERDPDLYRRIEAAVERGQWVPVGGTWVEPDCNIPSGESLARQFLLGQRFFERAFGRRCNEFWNPDVFGYNGQLPQIMALSGIHRFLTQKLSWNAFNRPDFHTFTWRGIDGTEVIAHFPPADTYNATADVAELRKNAANYRDADRSRHSLMLFGHGDGGGGPTARMLEYLRRARDIQGLPRTHQRTSDEFFSLLESDADELLTIVGELYFELHRATYTSQGRLKRDNRKAEVLLHDIECLAAIGHRLEAEPYPGPSLESLWRTLLLNQFHDILPGSSITQVYEDAGAQFRELFDTAGPLRDCAATTVAGKGDTPVVLNTLGISRAEVAEKPDGQLTFIETPPCGIGRIAEPPDEVRVNEEGNRIVLENANLRAVIDRGGTLIELWDRHNGRHALAGEGNVFELYDDHPTRWDAWDVDPFHLETATRCPDAERCEITAAGPLRGEVLFQRRLATGSTMQQHIRLDAAARRLEFHCTVDWQETHTFLKVAFPINASAMNATYEMQFGHVERPTHFNTPYDLARFEVPGHRWADLSEHGYGVSLLSDCKYGYSTRDNIMRLSLLRGPRHPDPEADLGTHQFAFALYPHKGNWREAGTVAEAMRFNSAPVWATGHAREPQSFFDVDDANLVLDTIKKAEDSDGLILRLYEAHGARGRARLTCNVPFDKAELCNLLEDRIDDVTVDGSTITLDYTPHQIITVRIE